MYTFIAHTKFDVNFNKAFNDGMGHSNYDPDDAAVHWMITANFRNGKGMDRSNTEHDQMRYQHRGYGKYADITRLFGWEAFNSYYYQKNLDANQEIARDFDMHQIDARTLHFSVAAKHDLTPLLQFWGMFAVKEDQLQARVKAKSLPPSEQVRCLLVRYRSLVPKTNADFKTFFNKIHPGMDCSNPGNKLYGRGWYCDWTDRWGKNGEGPKAVERINALLQKYFPSKEGASCAGVKTGAPGEGDVPRPKTWSWMPDQPKDSPTTTTKSGESTDSAATTKKSPAPKLTTPSPNAPTTTTKAPATDAVTTKAVDAACPYPMQAALGIAFSIYVCIFA